MAFPSLRKRWCGPIPSFPSRGGQILDRKGGLKREELRGLPFTPPPLMGTIRTGGLLVIGKGVSVEKHLVEVAFHGKDGRDRAETGGC
jgi:hypothetical protein